MCRDRAALSEALPHLLTGAAFFTAGGENKLTTSYGTWKAACIDRAAFLSRTAPCCRDCRQEAGNYKHGAGQSFSVLSCFQLQEVYLHETKNQRESAK